jgi:hypothetical protein
MFEHRLQSAVWLELPLWLQRRSCGAIPANPKAKSVGVRCLRRMALSTVEELIHTLSLLGRR